MTRPSHLVLSALLATAFSACLMAAPRPQVPLTVEKIYGHGDMTGSLPEGITWSPDGKHLTYIEDGQLMDLDPATGKSSVLVSRSKLAAISGTSATEQDRDHRERYKMASYLWSPDAKHLLFDSSGRLWLYDLHTGTGVQVGFTDTASGDDPKFSPNGQSISFIRNHGITVVHPREFGDPGPIAVAPAPNPTTTNGQVDWVYEEELDVRSNYFWSPDSKNIIFLQMIETDVPQYPITDWIPTHAVVDGQRYPQPGDPNPDVRLGIVGAAGGRTMWIRLPIKAGQDYIPRFGWVDSRLVWFETVTRDHKHRAVYFAEPGGGPIRRVVEIDDDKFLDENYDVHVGGGSIVLTNWKDGHNHVYAYAYDPRNPLSETALPEKQLTKGDFDVSGIATVDAEHKLVYYASNEANVLEQQLWQVSFDGERKQLTTTAGFHKGNFAPSGGAFVDNYSTRMQPPTLSFCASAGKCSEFWASRKLEPIQLVAPQMLQVKAKDGTTLYATLLLPAGETLPASVPLIVNPYGGPGPQEVQNKWGESNFLFDQLLAQHGFAVLHADNRGTGMRGRDFAQAAYHNFGPVQLEDQLAVVDAALAKYPQLDGDRLGWWGWSWGGSFTLYAMTHSDRFKAGVAVAPVTDWRDYDSIYTERYMSQPGDFPEGYKDFSAVNSAAKLKGHLLLVHGTGDDNVHIENSVQFIQQLIQAQLPYDFQIYPRKTHSIAGPDVRTHLFNRILAHFERYLEPSPVQ